MDSKVLVIGDDLGNVININPNKPEYGWFQVEQQAGEFVGNGWFQKKRRTAIISGKLEDLQEAGFFKGQILPGKIVVKESLTPFNTENPEKDLKIAGDTGVICRIDDQPIYRKSFYTTDLNVQDERIHHMNGEEIKEVQAAQRAMNNLSLKKAALESVEL